MHALLVVQLCHGGLHFGTGTVVDCEVCVALKCMVVQIVNHKSVCLVSASASTAVLALRACSSNLHCVLL